MKRMLRMSAAVLAGLCVLAAVAWILSRVVGNHETTYRGQTLYYWSVQLTNQDAAASNRASAVVYSEIIPHLTNQMFSDTNDSNLRLTIIDKLNELPGIEISDFARADSRRIQAVNGLATLGPAANCAAPALFEALRRKDPTLCCAVATAMASIQVDAQRAVPALLDCLLDSRGRPRPDVVDALGEYGPQAKTAFPVLVKLLNDRSSKEIGQAVPKALKRIDPEAAAKAIPPPPSLKPKPDRPSQPAAGAAHPAAGATAAGGPPPLPKQ